MSAFFCCFSGINEEIEIEIHEVDVRRNIYAQIFCGYCFIMYMCENNGLI